MAIVTVGKHECIVESLDHTRKDRVRLELHEGELNPRTTVEVVLTMRDGTRRTYEFRPVDVCTPPTK